MKLLDRKSTMNFGFPGYLIGQQIYESANSLVYRAIRAQDNQPVILKVLKPGHPQPEELTRYKQEYDILCRLDAAGIIKTYGLESDHQTLVLILEDFGGMSLNHWLEDWKRADPAAFSLSQFLKLASQIVAGIAQLHAAGVIHKHLTPANIVFNPDTGELKLIDFGLATVLSREMPTLKSPQGLEGTLAYLSPEQTGRMNRTVDYRTDFYSLGVAFYELLTGRLPFEATDTMELVHCHLAKMPDTPHGLNPAIPAVLSDLVLKLMAKAPEDRYQSARGLQHDLDLCLQSWQAHERVPVFELGRRDRADHFLIPEKLYGRATEVKTLLTAFERVAHGRAELILVTGFSGIGKTTVIHEVHKPIVRQRGYFIKGKFDQFNRNFPFSAFVQALRDLMGQLLSESDVQLEQWKTKILNDLGENGQVIIDVIPELERIIGPQPAVPELSGNAAQNRFNLLFQKFIATFTTAEHPLVIFLDDLQWADLASLRLIRLLMSAPHDGYLLLVGAYRDNEVSPTHPLRMTLDEIEKTGATLNTITLPPLLESDINQLIADTLGCSLKMALPLTQLVYQITRGNPFFNNQFLKMLSEEGLITFNREAGYWQCDLAQVNTLALADDVVEFMALQVQKLPQETQAVLKLAACMGNSFDLGTLAIIHQKSQGETVVDLWQAVQAGLVLPQREVYQFFQGSGPDSDLNHFTHADFQVPTYRFLHDRVQQAVYALIAADQQQSIHLQIGQLLLRNFSAAEREERLFEIVNHLNVGCSLIAAPQERENLAQLNLLAGRKAKTSTAYGAAIGYLTAGIKLLPSDGWERHYDLTLALHQEVAEAAYLNTDYAQMERWAVLVLQHARTLLDKVKIYEIRLMAARAQGQLLVALRIGLEVLQSLGVEFPDQPTPADIEQAFEAARQLWEGRPPLSLLDLPVMDDPSRLAAMQIMTILIPSAYMAAPAFAPLLICKEVEFAIQSGNCPIATYAYADYGMLLCGVIGDLEAGYEFGQLALKVLERFQATSGKSRAGLIVYQFISHWKEPLHQILLPLQEAYQNGLTTGDLESAGFNAFSYCCYSYFAGKELAGLADGIEVYRQTVRLLKQESPLKYLEIVEQTVLNLSGVISVPWELTGSVYSAEQSLPLHHANRDRTALFHVYFSQTILSYLFGQHSLAAQQSTLVEQYLDSVPGQFVVALYPFYDSLIHLAFYNEATAEQQAQILQRVHGHQAKMQRWAALAPFNHQHRWELVEAEQHRVLGHYPEAMEHYDCAIAGAKTHSYIQDEALANELAARFYLGWGKERVAQAYLQDAYDGYNRWGASAKVKQLEQHYPQFLAPILTTKKRRSSSDYFTSPSTLAASTAGAPLDLVTVIKASQAITGEIELARLLTQMMRIVIENVGAQRGALILERDGDWVIEAQGDLDSSDITVLQACDVQTSAAVSAEIVAHVARTRTSIVLDDAGSTGDFIHASYITQHKVKSVLCAPLVNQGRLSGIVYLENNLATKAFTTERLELLNLLSTQMALSLDNARLYQQAQQEIAERKLTEAALRESEERFRLFMHHFPGLAYIKDSATCHLFANQGFKTYLNIAPAEILGKTNQDIYPPEIAERFTTGDLRALESEQTQEIEEEYGGRIWSTYKFAIPQPDRPPLLGGFTLDITERKQVEEALRKSAEQYRAITSTSMDGFAIVDVAGRLLDVNDAYSRMIGYSRDELLKMSVSDIEAIATSEEIQTQHQKTIAGSQLFESRHHRKDGCIIDVEVSMTFMRQSGQILVFLRDITERKQAEAQLERSLRETRMRFEVSQALAGAETEEEVLDVLAKQSGLYPQAGTDIMILERGEEDELTLVSRRSSSFASGLPQTPQGTRFPASQFLIVNLIRPDMLFVSSDVFHDERVDEGTRALASQEGWTSLAIVPITAGENWLGVIVTVSKQEGYFDEEKQYLYQTLAEQGAATLHAARLQEAIRASQQRLSLLVQQSPLAVIEWNLDFKAVTWNPAAERIFGYTREEALGRHASFIVPKQTQPLVDQVWQALLAQKGGTYSANENLTRDGRLITCEWFNAPLIGVNGQVIGVAALVQDITARKQAEAEREKLIAELEAKNIELERFTYTVSHDLKSPLITIRGFLGYLTQNALA
ncbi:MAG: PAS domain S-box protein, partial [Anaerolineales bacterium]|nr:PAS domain S-box protein [Anaerolineales bacterium]